ncbi:hypothetical protein XENORESO_018428 [Xenotaenia resolanae]|uniref:WH1 domain-containing protein n=1 Tax=Xenotaenia resolanae TaxID=208358 RepID=A0ABV0XA15_9TELE
MLFFPLLPLQTMSSGVVQVFTADRNGSWNKRCCGVACLVKDNTKRSYFIRVFDIREGKTMFEQELYTGFTDNLQRPYFITFAGDTCQVGLNFSSEEETKRFDAALTEVTVKRNRRTGTTLLLISLLKPPLILSALQMFSHTLSFFTLCCFIGISCDSPAQSSTSFGVEGKCVTFNPVHVFFYFHFTILGYFALVYCINLQCGCTVKKSKGCKY